MSVTTEILLEEINNTLKRIADALEVIGGRYTETLQERMSRDSAEIADKDWEDLGDEDE